MSMSKASEMMSRRRLLARIGLAAGAVYAAPTLAGLDAAHASGNSGGNSGGSSGGNSRGSAPSGRGGNRGSVSRNSAPSRARGSSRPNGRRGQAPQWMRSLFR